MSIESIWANVALKAIISLLIFCLDGLSTEVSGVLKLPTIIVLLLISAFTSINIWFIYLGAPMSVRRYVSLLL